ncbi:MAG: FxLYD domain-containing protein [Bacteroidales bacterium]|nr:FxLYD domain-containing protein [Anaerotignum sp.]MCI5679537.1 FxLYD domain-containing protein [Bacteroidales bacterium]MDY3927004.1 FxLYD domain-containing protein [Anaerotignum sp.]
MYCRKCGALIPDDADYCTECGQACNYTKTNNNEPQKNICGKNNIYEIKKNISDIGKHKRKVIPVIIGLLVIVAVISILGGRCEANGCSNKAEYGDYCAMHVCLAPGCTFKRAYDSSYCYSHTDTIGGNASKDLKFSNLDIDHNSSYTVLNGTVTNTGNRTYEFIEIKGAFKDSSGKVVDTDWTYAVGSEGLAPGESTTFRMSVPKDYSIRDCSISIID